MIKNQMILENQKGIRNYQLILYPDSPLGEIFDVLTEMRTFILQKMQEASQSEIVKTENAPKE